MSETKKKPGIILPVIHLQNESQAVEMAGMAQEEGAGGVFLIDHKLETASDPEVLAEATVEVIRQFPELWVGVNCLGQTALDSLKYFGAGLGVDGVWTDNALNWQGHWDFRRSRIHADEGGELLSSVDKGRAMHFGGLSMKGRGYIDNDWAAASFIGYNQRYVDVATTSGVGTGISMRADRALTIKDAMTRADSPTKPLAIASGVNEFNVGYFVGEGRPVQHVLVGSSIETRSLSGIFDRHKLHNLISAVVDIEISNI